MSDNASTTGTQAACLLCGSAAAPWLRVPSRLDAERVYRLWRCESCDFGFISPRPDADELQRYYNEYFSNERADGDSLAHAGVLVRLDERLRQKVAWLADHGTTMDETVARLFGDEPIRACDIGCGEGRFVKLLRDRGAEAIGVEPNELAIRTGRDAGLEILEGRAEQLPESLERASFDLVTTSHVLEHTLDPQRALREAVSLVKPGGWLISETPNNACRSAARALACWPWLDVPRHVNFFTPTSLAALHREAGLEVAHVEFRGYVRMFRRPWIQREQRNWDFLADQPRNGLGPAGARMNPLRAWLLLARTLYAQAPLKYDSVRVVARKGGA